MTGRAYIGEVLIQIWLKSVKKFRQTSECTKREFEKIFRGSRKLPQAHEKCVMKMKEERKKRKNDCYIKFFVVTGRTLCIS